MGAGFGELTTSILLRIVPSKARRVLPEHASAPSVPATLTGMTSTGKVELSLTGTAGGATISTGSVHTSGALEVTTGSNSNLAEAVQSGLLSSQGGGAHTAKVQSRAVNPVQANNEPGGCCLHAVYPAVLSHGEASMHAVLPLMSLMVCLST